MDSKNIGISSLRIFMSYSTKDNILAGKLKVELENKGFEVFLAHEDLDYCPSFEEEIIKNLKRCDIFIPILTESFVKNYEWTVQELGMAKSEGKFIIPLQVDVAPFGFIRSVQGVKIKDYSENYVADKIYKIIISSDIFGKDIKDFTINKLIGSCTYAEANSRASALEEVNKFNEEEINRLVKGAIKNNQIYEGRRARVILKKLFEKSKELIPKDDYEEVMYWLTPHSGRIDMKVPKNVKKKNEEMGLI